ncbi:MAG: hypothetical protein GEU90_04245 [Gemmatimonas sp.]|nr:hypothetical protein [Gemmatimonas sp.]
MDEAERERIDAALQEWRQGDCALGEMWLFSRIAPAAPLTQEASTAADEGVDIAETEVSGFMVATQTCDIVRACGDRPFVEVCPLVGVDAGQLQHVQRGRFPRYAFVPALIDRMLVADLDRVMTVEKAVLAEWARISGSNSDEEARRLSLSLARKRARVAFPDDFVELTAALSDRLSGKHGKNSDEGRALRGLREIRVQAAPSWNADEVDLFFWFIRNEDEPTFEDKSWDQYLDGWMARVPPSGRFNSIGGVVVTLEDLTAQEYVESDPLDLDHLSLR